MNNIYIIKMIERNDIFEYLYTDKIRVVAELLKIASIKCTGSLCQVGSIAS